MVITHPDVDLHTLSRQCNTHSMALTFMVDPTGCAAIEGRWRWVAEARPCRPADGHLLLVLYDRELGRCTGWPRHAVAPACWRVRWMDGGQRRWTEIRGVMTWKQQDDKPNQWKGATWNPSPNRDPWSLMETNTWASFESMEKCTMVVPRTECRVISMKMIMLQQCRPCAASIGKDCFSCWLSSRLEGSKS